MVGRAGEVGGPRRPLIPGGTGFIIRGIPTPLAGAMTQFLGTHKGKLDKKGRISVPAAFRGVLEETGLLDIVLVLAFDQSCINVWPKARFEAMSAQYRRLDYFSAKAGTLGSVLFGDVHPARPDADGRIVLPEDLIQDGELTEAVSIVGHDEDLPDRLRDTDRHIAFRREQRQRAREEALTLPSARPEGGAP